MEDDSDSEILNESILSIMSDQEEDKEDFKEQQ
jgi:hypothetical protein